MISACRALVDRATASSHGDGSRRPHSMAAPSTNCRPLAASSPTGLRGTRASRPSSRSSTRRARRRARDPCQPARRALSRRGPLRPRSPRARRMVAQAGLRVWVVFDDASLGDGGSFHPQLSADVVRQIADYGIYAWAARDLPAPRREGRRRRPRAGSHGRGLEPRGRIGSRSARRARAGTCDRNGPVLRVPRQRRGRHHLRRPHGRRRAARPRQPGRPDPGPLRGR